jgi:predicted naringenin-chalcone synthase
LRSNFINHGTQSFKNQGKREHADSERDERISEAVLPAAGHGGGARTLLGRRTVEPRSIAAIAQVGVDGRYLALPIEQYPTLGAWGEANDHWIRVAQELGECAIRRAAVQAGLDVRELRAFFFTSVTGIASPSIEARLVNRMGLSPEIRRIPMFGLGCVAGAAGIARAADYVRAYPEQAAVLLSVELCSLTLQRKDLSMANLISAGLFGDGAAAVIVGGTECVRRRMRGRRSWRRVRCFIRRRKK